MSAEVDFGKVQAQENLEKEINPSTHFQTITSPHPDLLSTQSQNIYNGIKERKQSSTQLFGSIGQAYRPATNLCCGCQCRAKRCSKGRCLHLIPADPRCEDN
jgi:hypothetical protein